MGQRPRPPAWVMATLAIALTPGATPGQELPPADIPAERAQAARLAQSYIDGFCRRERLAAGNVFLEKEVRRLEATLEPHSPSEDLLADLGRIDAETCQALGRLLQDRHWVACSRTTSRRWSKISTTASRS